MGYQVSLFTVYLVLHWKYCMLLTFAAAFLLVGVFLTTTHSVVRNERVHTHTYSFTHMSIPSAVCNFIVACKQV